MDSTKVDDMLIKMIAPKLADIETRFTNGEGLSNDDTNTLLLKSQYNHINHLDQRMDQITESVQGLRENFRGLEDKLVGVEGKFMGLDGKFLGLEGKFDRLKTDMEGKFDLLRSEIETTIQKALNRNMVLLIGMMGFFLTLPKVIDKILLKTIY